MLIDYIYLILIIVIICFILFLIYLSYKYRIESFTLPAINSSPNNDPNIIKNLETSLLNNYKKFYVDTYNDQINDINYKNLDIYNKTSLNLDNSKSLANINIIPITDDFPIDKLIKTIKSKYNSQHLSTFKNDINKYGILANDKCLTVNGLCNGEFCLLDCQNKIYSTNSQKFTSNRINTANDAARIMNVDYSKINTENVYPFNIFQSMVNNKCLTISNNGITIDKCNLNNKKQQWEISPDENICYLT